MPFVFISYYKDDRCIVSSYKLETIPSLSYASLNLRQFLYIDIGKVPSILIRIISNPQYKHKKSIADSTDGYQDKIQVS